MAKVTVHTPGTRHTKGGRGDPQGEVEVREVPNGYIEVSDNGGGSHDTFSDLAEARAHAASLDAQENSVARSIAADFEQLRPSPKRQ